MSFLPTRTLIGTSDPLKLHELLRFKDKMTEDQLKRIQEKVLHGNRPQSDAVTLYEHGIKLIPELLKMVVFELASLGNVSILTKPEFKDALKMQDREGRTPIYILAGFSKHILKSEYKDLLKIQNNEGYTTLHSMALNGKTEILNPEFKDILKIQNKWKQTPLHLLAQRGKTEILNPEFKDILKIQDKNGDTPLHVLALYKKKEILNPEYADWEAMHLKNDKGQTPADFLKERLNDDKALPADLPTVFRTSSALKQSVQASSGPLNLHEILRFKDKMTGDQLKKLQEKVLHSKDVGRNAAILYTHGIKLIPELIVKVVWELAGQGDVSILTKPEFKDALRTQGSGGFTPIHLLAIMGKTEFLKPEFMDMLLIRTEEGNTALHILTNDIAEGDIRIQDILKPEYKKILEIQNRSGNTILHNLARAGYTEILDPEFKDILKKENNQGNNPVQILLARKPEAIKDVSDFERKYISKLSSSDPLKLHELLRFKDKMTEDQLKRLQEKVLHGPKVTWPDSSENAMILYEHGIKLIPELLKEVVFELAHRGDVSILTKPEFKDLLKIHNKYSKSTPIHYLCGAGKTEMLKPEFKDLLKIQNGVGDTPLHTLASFGRTEILKFKDILYIQNKDGNTPLHFLAEKGNTEILKPEFKDLLRIWNKDDNTPLHFLALMGKTEILNSEFKDLFNIQNKDGNTPLHILASVSPQAYREINKPEYNDWEAIHLKNDEGQTPRDVQTKRFIKDSSESEDDITRLEKELEKKYREGAPQKEIDDLETELAKHVSEEEPTSEEDVINEQSAVSEGISIEEELRNLYKKYLSASEKDRPDIVETMRSVLEGSDYIYTPERPKIITDEQVLDAAKDVYERHLHLKLRRQKPRINPTPEEVVRTLKRIRERTKKAARRVILSWIKAYSESLSCVKEGLTYGRSI